MRIAKLRKEYHHRICEEILTIRPPSKKAIEGYPSFADGTNRPSIEIAWRIVNRLDYPVDKVRRENPDEDEKPSIGGQFEKVTRDFLEKAFELLHHLRPGEWQYSTNFSIASFDQYEHLADLDRMVKHAKELDVELGGLLERALGDYVIKPDIVIGRWPVSDDAVNQEQSILDAADPVAKLTPLREVNYDPPHAILHASISCKWTLRSDRAQSTRTEALNLIRNRKGPLPHIVAITAEPLPSRISSLAQGTGDMDCVYHFALPELEAAVEETGTENQKDTLRVLLQGRRLRDISDLPFDLAT